MSVNTTDSLDAFVAALIKEIDRRNMMDAAHAQARQLWRYGRSDRIAGLNKSIIFGEDPVYLAGYEGERRKEVNHAEETPPDSSRNSSVQDPG
jgi:hypothetical protein